MAEQKASRELALKEKVHLIRFLETNSQRKTAERFHVSKTTVSNIQRRKREYLERYDKESGDAQRKRNRTSLDQVSQAALSWFKQMRAWNARISGPVTQEVARRFALEFELTGFQASSGRLEKFMLRHKISQKILCGESNEVPVEVLEDFIAKFRYFASGFKEESIFNADECALPLKAMPDRSLALKDQEDDVELRPDSPTREAEIEGVDFEDFVAIGDEAATSTEPDPQAVYQSILAAAGMSVEASSAGDDAE
ncbi:hypothetical protein M513_13612 [Trichuris suis]|uniref:HTH CENPB-type domain-containing protein n=1 Tax=Trichuris suis TaxID=68888 RepID=A0A085LKK9_9BILA|nr:hypothetical protein M513_13612 [Trichuris suis]